MLPAVLVASLFTFLFIPVASPSRHGTRQTVLTDLPGDWSFFACFEDNPDVPGVGRSLSGATFTNATGMTIEACVNFCLSQSFIFAGLEFGQECWCDNVFEHVEESVGNDECNQPCVGNPAELCGAANRLSVYTSNTPAVFPSLVASVGPWVSLGCFNDTDTARALQRRVNAGNTTVESCTAACQNEGFTLAGLGFGQECWCGSRFLNGSIFVGNSNGINGNVRQAGMNGMFCSMGCVGNTSELCGGPQRLNVYNFTGPVAATVPSVGLWESIGCWNDSTSVRTLRTQVNPIGGVTAESCTAECLSGGFGLAGLEFGQECWCGTALPARMPTAQASTCDMPCAVDSLELCGGPLALTLYQFEDVSPAVDDFATVISLTNNLTTLVSSITSANVETVGSQVQLDLLDIELFIRNNITDDSAGITSNGINFIIGPNDVLVSNAFNSWIPAVQGLSNSLISQSSILVANSFDVFIVEILNGIIEFVSFLTGVLSGEVAPNQSGDIFATNDVIIDSLEQAVATF